MLLRSRLSRLRAVRGGLQVEPGGHVEDQARLALRGVEGGFRDPSQVVAGQDFGTTATAEAVVFALTPTKVLAFGKGEPFSQSRYRF